MYFHSNILKLMKVILKYEKVCLFELFLYKKESEAKLQS